MPKPTFKKKFDRADKKPRNAIHHETFKTVCSVCSKACEVPFKPNGKKPVFCDSCFSKTKESITPTFTKRKDKTIFDTPEDVIMPAYSPNGVGTDVRFAELKRELSSANAKLDKLIDLFNKLK